LVTQLLDTVRQAFEIESQTQEQWRIENGLIGLGAVVKELASVKLGMAVAAFQQVLGTLCPRILDLYSGPQTLQMCPLLFGWIPGV
jgi:hypothetical protein